MRNETCAVTADCHPPFGECQRATCVCEPGFYAGSHCLWSNYGVEFGGGSPLWSVEIVLIAVLYGALAFLCTYDLIRTRGEKLSLLTPASLAKVVIAFFCIVRSMTNFFELAMNLAMFPLVGIYVASTLIRPMAGSFAAAAYALVTLQWIRIVDRIQHLNRIVGKQLRVLRILIAVGFLPVILLLLLVAGAFIWSRADFYVKILPVFNFAYSGFILINAAIGVYYCIRVFANIDFTTKSQVRFAARTRYLIATHLGFIVYVILFLVVNAIVVKLALTSEIVIRNVAQRVVFPLVELSLCTLFYLVTEKFMRNLWTRNGKIVLTGTDDVAAVSSSSARPQSPTTTTEDVAS